MSYPRIAFDVDAYIDRITGDGEVGRCFICDIVAGDASHHLIYRDDQCVAFLNLYPRLVGYTLLAPLDHKTNIVSDFTEHEYLELQRRVHRVGRAICAVVPTERLYVFSFGSHQAISHVHWHIAPLPPGVPFREQQFDAVIGHEYYDIPEPDKADLAARIRAGVG